MSSQLKFNLPPSPIKTIIGDKLTYFNQVWSRWFSDLYNFIMTKINYTLSVPLTSTTIANTTTETVLISATVNSNSLYENSNLTVKIHGVSSSHSIAPILTFRLRIGTTTKTGNIVSTIAITPDINKTNESIFLEFNCTIRTNGAVGSIIGNGFMLHSLSNTSYIGSTQTSTVAIDSTVTNLIELTAQFSSANANNSISLHNGFIDIKNIMY